MKKLAMSLILGSMSLNVFATSEACRKMIDQTPELTVGRVLLNCVPTEYRGKHPNLRLPEICFALERGNNEVDGAIFDSANKVWAGRSGFLSPESMQRYIQGQNIHNDSIRNFRMGFTFDAERSDGMITYLKEGLFSSERYGQVIFKCQ